MKHYLKFFAVFFLIYCTQFVKADEGMWMPHQMKMLNLKAHGMQMNPDDLFKEDGTGLMSAVVSFGGGTGEFVSKDGLILTNHHVAFGAIQRASSVEHDYIQNGFIAKEKHLEIPAQAYIADVLLGYEEVTDKVQAVLKSNMTYAERSEAIDQVRRKLEEEAQKEGSDIRAVFKSMYSGNQYYLFRFKRIRDVRIVYAPPLDIGKFGGDIDNWMWPRHTCDFTFLRAYVSKDGEGVEYSEDNVPYQPKSIMKISLEGLKEGDFTFVMGYPGSTQRNYTLQEFVNGMQTMQRNVSLYGNIIEFLENEVKNSREVEIKYASKVSSLNNVHKNIEGKLSGFEKNDLFDKKKEQQDKLIAWIEGNNKNRKKYGHAVSEAEEFLKWYAEWEKKSSFLFVVSNNYSGPAILMQGMYINRIVSQRTDDENNDSNYIERVLEDQRKANREIERTYDLTLDRKYFKVLLNNMLDLSESEIPDVFKEVLKQKSSQAISEYVDNLYDRTSLSDHDKRSEMLGMTIEQLNSLEDPMLKLAVEIQKEREVFLAERVEVMQKYQDLKKNYIAALIDMKNGELSPDANSSIRFTYGHVEGYQPADAVYYKPFTTLKGVMEKETGEYPFYVPDKLKKLYETQDFGKYKDETADDIVTCFLNTTNVTGGNSGSATLNAKGEQVGIIFDMTYESVIGDFYIIPELQRTISVDIRYVLFITEKFSGCDFIIKEIGV